jgi:hypothetical protein
MGEELSRLLATGFILEIQHLDWIANLVLVLKKNGKWWMCVDYMILNKACHRILSLFPESTRSLTSLSGVSS